MQLGVFLWCAAVCAQAAELQIQPEYLRTAPDGEVVAADRPAAGHPRPSSLVGARAGYVSLQVIAKLHAELRREQDLIASLRAEWSKLDRPDRLQELAQRHLPLKPLDIRQYDPLDKLPEKPIELVPPGTADPIVAVIETLVDPDTLTGSMPDEGRQR